jgi:methionyl-tRNA synthetase
LVDENKSSDDALDDEVEGVVCRRLGNHAQLGSLPYGELTMPGSVFSLPGFFLTLKFKENLMSGKIYITTTIPYVNARPHIGFALELVQADVIARYNRLIGNETYFQTGTDENAFKNVVSARRLGITTRELVGKNSDVFRELSCVLNISCDNFIRTTDPAHHSSVRLFWKRLRAEDVYVRTYTGLYCNGCEDFYRPKDLVNGCCPDHKTRPAEVHETNYFFRLSAYQSQLEQLLETDTLKIVPTSRKNEVLSFIRSGLRDLSISRNSKRSGGWGVPVPGDAAQVIWVWFDALTNYISGLGYDKENNWKHFWNESATKIHVIGKNVWKFHAVYWPAFLLSAGLPVPNEIFVHGFITEKGQKISKSHGGSIDPFECAGSFGADAVRYYLLRAIHPFDDGDFSTQRLKRLYNADLANGLGNLVSRVTSLCNKAGFEECKYPSTINEPEGYCAAVRNYEFDKALEILWRIITRTNQDIDRARPWDLLKRPNDASIKTLLSAWLRDIREVGYWLRPFLPETSKKIFKILEGPFKHSEALFPRVK